MHQEGPTTLLHGIKKFPHTCACQQDPIVMNSDKQGDYFRREYATHVRNEDAGSLACVNRPWYEVAHGIQMVHQHHQTGAPSPPEYEQGRDSMSTTAEKRNTNPPVQLPRRIFVLKCRTSARKVFVPGPKALESDHRTRQEFHGSQQPHRNPRPRHVIPPTHSAAFLHPSSFSFSCSTAFPGPSACGFALQPVSQALHSWVALFFRE